MQVTWLHHYTRLAPPIEHHGGDSAVGLDIVAGGITGLSRSRRPLHEREGFHISAEEQVIDNLVAFAVDLGVEE